MEGNSDINTTWMDLEEMLSKISQLQKDKSMFPLLYEVLIVKFI